MQPVDEYVQNSKIFKHTCKILQCLQHNVSKGVFNHFFVNVMYEVDKLFKQLMNKYFWAKKVT